MTLHRLGFDGDGDCGSQGSGIVSEHRVEYCRTTDLDGVLSCRLTVERHYYCHHCYHQRGGETGRLLQSSEASAGLAGVVVNRRGNGEWEHCTFWATCDSSTWKLLSCSRVRKRYPRFQREGVMLPMMEVVGSLTVPFFPSATSPVLSQAQVQCMVGRMLAQDKR